MVVAEAADVAVDDGGARNVEECSDAPNTVDSTSVLVKQLNHLMTVPNQFQCHARASLRLLDRRRRRPAKQRAPVGAGFAKPEQKPVADTSGKETEVVNSGSVGRTITEPARRAYSGLPATTANGESSEKEGMQHLKEVHSDPIVSRYRDMMGRSGSVLPSVSSLPLFELGTNVTWTSDIYRLLQATGEREGVDCERIEPATSGLRLHCGAYQIPHPRKAEAGGEDSFFTCPSGTAAGVADGVGEWEWRFGLNPRAFADELMEGSKQAAQTVLEYPELSLREQALRVLEEGFAKTKSFGSATALVTILDPTGSELGVANLGDSGLRQIRRRHDGQPDLGTRIIRRTEDQQHSFNCPYQLARLPKPEDFARLRAQGKSALVRAVQKTPASRQDVPSDAQPYALALKEGDLLVIGTDGVFDNLHDREVAQLADLATSPLEARQTLDVASGTLSGGGSTEPRNVAKAIAQAALLRSTDQSARTPFCLNAKEAGLCHVGGKMDDITVVVAWVVRAA